MSEENEALIAKVNKQLAETLKGYTGRIVDDTQMDNLRKALTAALSKTTEAFHEREFQEHITITDVPSINPDKIEFTFTLADPANAPGWARDFMLRLLEPEAQKAVEIIRQYQSIAPPETVLAMWNRIMEGYCSNCGGFAFRCFCKLED